MARGKSPAFQFYPDAWLSSMDVRVMGPVGRSAYFDLLCHAWLQRDCGLPDDDEQLAILSGVGSDWERVSARVRAKFRAEGGRLYNDRLLEERGKQTGWSQKSSNGGRKSAEVRRAKREAARLAAIEAESRFQSALPLTDAPTPPTTTGTAASSHLVEKFHDWIAEYPNPVRVDTALQSWISLIASGEITDATLPDVFAGLRRWKKSRAWAEDDGKYIPAPNVFLTGNERHTGRLWKDQPPESAEAKAAERTAKRSRDGVDPNAEWIAPWEED